MTDPMIVYGMVGVLIGAIVLALIFSRPRRGLGAAKPMDASRTRAADGAWMPGGDIFGHDTPAAESELPQELPTFPSMPSAPPGAMPPPAHDPWSSAPTERVGQQPRWDKP